MKIDKFDRLAKEHIEINPFAGIEEMGAKAYWTSRREALAVLLRSEITKAEDKLMVRVDLANDLLVDYIYEVAGDEGIDELDKRLDKMWAEYPND